MPIFVSKVIATLKRFTTREKFLLFLFCCVMLLIWTNAQLAKLTDIRTARAAIQSDLREQAAWLARADEILLDLRDALALVDPSRTYSATQLTGRIDSLARASRLTADIDPVNTREGQIFNDHRVRVRMNRITPERLLAFTHRLHEEAPYIALGRLSLNPSRANPEELDVRFEISSFEVKQTPEIPD